MQLDFDQIVSGEDQQKQSKKLEEKQINLTKTETRARQGSCMIDQIDKDLLPSNIKNNSGPSFRVSLVDMLNIDKADESLQTYKKQLLGEIKEEELREDQPAEVQIVKVQVVCPDRPQGNIKLDFLKGDKLFFQIKQSSVYHLRIHFIVRNDIVNALKFVNNVYKLLARVEKQEHKMGSFAPQKEPHYFDLEWVQAPSGFIARGEYKGKGLFLDADGIVHCQFDYSFKIASDW